MTIDGSFQVRKLPPSHITQLSLILELSEQWKKLMAVIPERLSKHTFECSISNMNPAKYNADHIRLIETASLKYKKCGTEILLEEWGCSGRILPTVGHLLHLLSTAELYRAADYVSEKILGRGSNKKPSVGPAAEISLNMNSNIENNLEDMKYSSTLIENIDFNTINNNLNYNSSRLCIPPIVITPDADELMQNPMSISNNESMSLPNLILFSKDGTALDTPVSNTSSMDKSDSNESIKDIPLLSCLLEQSKSDNEQITMESYQNSSTIDQTLSESSCISQSSVLPALSNLCQSENLDDNSENFLPKLEEMGNSEDLIPNLSGLDQSDSDCQGNSQNDESSLNLPVISALIQTSSECIEIEHINSSNKFNFSSSVSSLPMESDRLTVNTFDSSKSRKCNSPLPNLTLTTHLPHIGYEQLKSSTNEFNEEVFDGFDKKGRLLGCGAFGKVFLGTGISQEPVAVKKIILNDVDVVNIDDRVTKQFINEVEVLSKYKHKNLVSLLGFSCDGCTYCLLYEYIPGGTLQQRLQKKESKLAWQERLSIAMGTANAITYLHTAFSTPLIHRDVKTANILLDHSNKPKLGDFGITTLLDNKSMNTCTVIGTSAYMAPEAMRGDISVKCDTFSFGVVLLELLTSLPPFDESRDGHDLITHVEEKCENSIADLLDTSIGSWVVGDKNFGEEIYMIAVQCIEEKKKRPVMVDVNEMLMITISKL